ncbi:MAG: type II secretion system minor pseudopilin GspK [Parvularculaceae bacterium]
MMRLRSSERGQRGAALIIVLLLVATLAFILLSITDRVTASVQRSAADRARAELLWRGAAAQEVARRMLAKAAEAGAFDKVAPNSGLLSQEFELPFGTGTAALRFQDASRCFNLNALVSAPADDSGAESTVTEADRLAQLGVARGLGDSEARNFASVVADFLDKDAAERIQGAEDGFYSALPVPYRTAGGDIASVSEIRAMDGVSRDLYRRVKPLLCTIAGAEQPSVNLNFLDAQDAPLIFAMTNGEWSLGEIRDQIEKRPPGGWNEVNDFWAPYVEKGGAAPSSPGSLTSSRIEALVRLEVNGRTMEEKLLFEVKSGAEPKLVAHTFGDDY